MQGFGQAAEVLYKHISSAGLQAAAHFAQLILCRHYKKVPPEGAAGGHI